MVKQFVIKSITDLIYDYKKLVSQCKNPLFIFITTNKYDYDFDAVVLDFKDVSIGEEGFITEKHTNILKGIDFNEYDGWFIGCDAGYCRSPAVASAVCRYMGWNKASDNLKNKYQYMNMDVYGYIVTKLCGEVMKKLKQ